MDRSGGDLSALVLHQSRRREPFRLDFVAGDHKGWWQGKKEEARGGSMRLDDDGGSDGIEFIVYF